MTVAMRCQCKYKYVYIYFVFMLQKKHSYLVDLNADIGADVLDLAENMVASDGLKYEPVSMTNNNVSTVL